MEGKGLENNPGFPLTFPLSAKGLRNRAEAQAASAPEVKGLQAHAREGDQDDTSFEDGGGTSGPEERSVTLGGWRGNRGGWRQFILRRPHHMPLDLASPAPARKEGFLLRCCPAQSILTGFLQDSWTSRKILTRDRMMGTAIGRKSGM